MGFFGIHSGNLTYQWKIHHLKMYFLFKMGIFHCYVCLPEGSFFSCYTPYGSNHLTSEDERLGCTITSESAIYLGSVKPFSVSVIQDPYRDGSSSPLR